MLPNFFSFHNHSLPIEDYFKSLEQFAKGTGSNSKTEEEQEQKNLEKEREQILGKLLKKKDVGAGKRGHHHHHYSSSSSSDAEKVTPKSS